MLFGLFSLNLIYPKQIFIDTLIRIGIYAVAGYFFSDYFSRFPRREKHNLWLFMAKHSNTLLGQTPESGKRTC